MDAATQNFPFVCAAITSYREPPQDLEQRFGQAVLFFAQKVKQQTNWPQYYATFPETLRRDLQQRFQLC